jgi:CubicO group peptidase (beta-lactamase class C family)
MESMLIVSWRTRAAEGEAKAMHFLGRNMVRFAQWLGPILVVGVSIPAFSAQNKAPAEFPVTGRADPNLAGFDRLVISFMKKHQVPGGALAVTKDGRVVYSRGFGYADTGKMQPVVPQALFRIASISKPITAAAVLKLVEQGKLKLDDFAFQILQLQPFLEEKKRVDPRLRKITIRQLLQHTAGWDRDKSFDPMFESVKIARALKVPPPAHAEHVIRYMMGQPLDFAPGARYAYSNFGYCVLGRIIEKVSGQSYESYVRQHILRPLGIRDMRIGRTLPQGRAAGEVHYYAGKDRTAPAVFAGMLDRNVPTPYGAWYLEAMDAHGGWIASAVDLVRFASAFDHPDHSKLLQAKTIDLMFARPPGLAGLTKNGKPRATYYACGWSVRPVGKKGHSTWHPGALDGTGTLLVRRADGVNWAVLFNKRHDQKGKALTAEIEPLLHAAADQVTRWP